MAVVDEELGPRAPVDWRARYRVGADASWADCRILDISLGGAVVELSDETSIEVPADASADEHFILRIDTIADDDVGIVMQAVIQDRGLSDAGRPVVDIEFSARREERLLLHLLVRLHSLV